MLREWSIFLLGALVLFPVGGCAPPSAPERIILVVADTLRVDHVGVYGGEEVETPNLDALAARGQTLQALAAYHQTSMSMGALFTGRTPSIEADGGKALSWTQTTFCGMARFRNEGDACLPPAPGRLAEDLRDAGYETLGVTANPLLFRPYGYDRGFDVWREVGQVPPDRFRRMSKREHADSRTGAQVQAAVAEVLAGRGSDRFFLYVHYLDVHDWLLRRHSYRKGVAAFDAYLGELLATLEREGVLDGSLVVVTSDHGESLARDPHPVRTRSHQGNPSYDSVLRVPLIVAPPVFPDGAAVRGQDLRAHLVALVRGEVPSRRAEVPELFIGEARYRTYRSEGFKSSWPRDGGAPLLFDLRRDPGETQNVAAAHRAVLERHRRRVEDLSAELGAGGTPTPMLEKQAADRLRALGYLE